MGVMGQTGPLPEDAARQGRECVAGVSLGLAVQPGVKVSSEVCRKQAVLLESWVRSVPRTVGIPAQDGLDCCQRRPERGLRATAGAQTSPGQVPRGLSS